MQPGQQKISQFDEVTSAQSGDILPLVRNGQNKRITVGNFAGVPPEGYTAAAQIWTYLSFSATTQIGTITVPTDATVKYNSGMRIQITQATGGIKYGIIQMVTATVLHVMFPAGTTLNNEAISTPFYTSLFAPLGFPMDPNLFTLEVSPSANVVQGSPTALAWYNAALLAVGVGRYVCDYEATHWIVKGSAPVVWGFITLSTTNNGITDPKMGSMTYASATELMNTGKRQRVYNFTSPTTLYLNHAVNQASVTQTAIYTSDAANTRSVVRARCAYI